MAGVIDGANVRLVFSQENGGAVQHIAVNADGEGLNSFHINWHAGGRHLTIGVGNCELDDVPFELMNKLLAEMRTVQMSVGESIMNEE